MIRATKTRYRMTILTGCGKTKATTPQPARELYTSPLCRARRRYAEHQLASWESDDLLDITGQWFILSAKFGLVDPDRELPPYEQQLRHHCPADRAAWYLHCAQLLLDGMEDDEDLKHHQIQIHAGEDYAKPLLNVLWSLGFSPQWVTEGMQIGEQLAFYRRRNTEFRKLAGK